MHKSINQCAQPNAKHCAVPWSIEEFWPSGVQGDRHVDKAHTFHHKLKSHKDSRASNGTRAGDQSLDSNLLPLKFTC